MFGRGDPTFNFYAWAIYYFIELVHLVGGLNFADAFAIASGVLVLVGGCGTYCLAQDLFARERSPYAPLVSAVAYMYAPYLLTNVFVRGAIAEVGAQALLPWLLWAIRRLMRAQRPAAYVLPVGALLTALVLTHTVSLVVVPPFLLAYVVVLWRRGESSRLMWLFVAGLAAIGVSALYWVPLVAERGYLANAAYDFSRNNLGRNVWSWQDFLDGALRFNYTFNTPYRLGLVQLLLAAIGAILARRLDREWLFFVVTALLYGLLVGAWASPVWLASSVLLTVQFPWRLLAIISMSLAVLAGGIVTWLRSTLWQLGFTIVVVGLILYAGAPNLSWMRAMPEEFGRATLSEIARWEATSGLIGLTATGEFRPRWAESDTYRAELETSQTMSVSVQRAFLTGLQMSVASEAGGRLRLAASYFPGWRALLDGRTSLPTYPSTNLGLLSVDVPAGKHDLSLSWSGTALQHIVGFVTLAALTLLAWFCWRQAQRWAVPFLLSLAIIAAAALYWPQRVMPIYVPQQPLATADVELLGFRTEQDAPSRLYIYPYWYVKANPASSLLVHWTLRDSLGNLVSEIAEQPHYGTYPATDWPPGTLVSDAYALYLPPGLPAGTYHLAAGITTTAGQAGSVQSIGPVEIRNGVSDEPRPRENLDLGFGDEIRLAGYDLKVNRRPIDTTQGHPVIVQPGDILQYTLYWRAVQPTSVDYHSYVHVTDLAGKSIMLGDQSVGKQFGELPFQGDSYLQADEYQMVVPENGAGKLYETQVGLYMIDPVRLLPVRDASGHDLGDHASLAPIKVVGRSPAFPKHATLVRLGDFARIEGYETSSLGATLRPGSQLTLTVYYRADRAIATDYTRFVHLYSPERGMAAQFDSPPQGGNNPVHSWVPGEVVRDVVTLTVDPSALPGKYDLSIGFYDPQAGNKRLSLSAPDGRRLPDDAVILATVSVGD